MSESNPVRFKFYSWNEEACWTGLGIHLALYRHKEFWSFVPNIAFFGKRYSLRITNMGNL